MVFLYPIAIKNSILIDTILSMSVGIFVKNIFMSKQFSDLGINKQLRQSLVDLQISVPTDIQEKTIPLILNQNKDVVALAKTGTGKTAAFGLPLIQLIDLENTNIQAVVLAPTRELGQQIYTNLVAFASYCQGDISAFPNSRHFQQVGQPAFIGVIKNNSPCLV